MKKQILLLALILLPMVASADAVEIDGLFYNLNYETKEASVISASENCKGDIVIPSDVEINGQTFNVISIEDRAFKGCHELTSVTISNGLYSIGDNAFSGCYELTSISFPSSFAILGDEVFVDCWNLKSVNVSDLEAWCKVSFSSSPFYEHQLYINGNEIKDLVIPEGVTKINKYVFSRCTNIQTITMTNSVKEIGEGAFYKCDSLESVILSNSTEIIRECAFEGCVNLKSISIPNSVTSIENRTFQNCSSLTSVEIPNSVKSIGSSAFQNCKELVSAPIPNGVVTIGDRAFEGCKNLTTIEIPDGVVTIGEWAFCDCDGFSSLFIPNSVTSIGVAAFSGCNGIMSIKVSDGNMVYDSRYNCNAIIETESNTMLIGCNNSVIPNSIQFIGGSAFQRCNELKTIEIPSTVTRIEGNAFAGSGLVSIDIPNSVKSIMSGAFSGCKSLTSIKLPNSISSIEEGTFSNCSSLTSLEIPNSVNYIGRYAFEQCKGLLSINIPNSVTSIGSWAFYACHSLKNVSISNGIEEIGNCFTYCIKLETISIPKSVKKIASRAFEGCYVLNDVYCFADEVPEMGSDAIVFPVIDNNTTLHVPANSIENYKKAYIWNGFGSIVALTDEELKMYDDANPESTVNPEPDGVIEGVYLIQPESYRIYNGNKQTYDRSFDILITDNGDGSYHVNDLLGGWYQRYGINYAMTGNIVIAADGTVSLKDSYIAGWGDSLVGLTGSYDASTSSFTIEAEYVEGMKFFQTWVKDYKVFTVDGINYRIGENFTVSVIKGYYSGDIVIPEMVSYNGITYSVASIDEKAFRWCTDITSVIIPNSVTSLGQRSFEGCKNLSFVSIPNSVTYIDESVFLNCSSLNSVNIPNSVVSIGYGAFFECYSLSNLTLSENLTTIGESSFTACNGLKSLIIPASVLKIGNHAFSECEGLESVKVENENTKYDSRNDCNAIIETYSNRLILGCKNTVIPQDVTIIGDGAFAGCVDLKMLDIPNSVTTIENGAFWRCIGLRNFIVGSNVKRIDRGAFQECSGLHSIVLPSAVKQIGLWSFSKCQELKDFYLYADICPSTDIEAFYETPIANATLHVPAVSVEVYKQTEPWSGFGKIVALTDDDPKPTDVNTLKADQNVYPVNTYTVEGRRIPNPQRGLNIIRMSDGTTRKVLLK